MFDKLRELTSGNCTLWFESAFGVDWTMSCWAHDRSYEKCTVIEKLKGDGELFLDLWEIADVAGKWWQRAILKANAVAMFAGVSTAGTVIHMVECN